jgi:hypothetical protein
LKKILSIIFISAFLLIPLLSFAKTAVSDNDLSSVTAQRGSIIVTFDDIYVNSAALKTTSTDGLDFWNPFYNPPDNYGHAAYYGPENPDYENNLFFSGTDVWPQKGYVGYADVFVTGGTVQRSGYIRLEVVSTANPNVFSLCQLNVELNQTIRSNLGIDATIKLGASRSDLVNGTQSLGRVYSQGIGATTVGSLSVYAHNNDLWP